MTPRRWLKRHGRLVKPGGYLLLGVPNFQGINGWFIRRLGPDTLAGHRVPTMDISRWVEWERIHDLTVIFKGYVGGLKPRVFRLRERSHRLAWLLGLALAPLSRLNFHRRLNGPSVSGYAVAIYRRSADGGKRSPG